MAFSEDLASARRISSPSQEEPLINLDLQSLQRYNDLTLEILKNIQEQDKRHQEKMQELDKRHRERIQEHRELMSINQLNLKLLTALCEMLITPKSLAEPKENPVSPTSHSGMLVDSEPEETLVSPIFHTSVLVDPTPSSANLPAQVPQSFINLQPQPVPVFDSTSMSSFLFRPSLTVQSYKPSPEPDPSGDNIQSFSLTVQNFEETDSRLSPAALFHLSPPKPPPDPSHQADNINVVLMPFRATHTALDLRYDLSANIPRLKCSNTREPLRLTPTTVLTSLRLAPVLPRPPSTALT